MEKLLSTSETAALLRIAAKTLYDRRWRAHWGLQGIRVGRLLRFRESDIEGFLKRESEAGADVLSNRQTTS